MSDALFPGVMDSQKIDAILQFSMFPSAASPNELDCMLANPNDTILRGLADSTSAARMSRIMVVANGKHELPTTFPALAKFPILRDLHLEHFPAEAFLQMGGAKTLEQLFLEWCDTPQDLAFAGKLPSLCDLTIRNCLTLESLDGIEKLFNLRFARFFNCPQLADLSAFTKLSDNQSLVELQVVNTAVADLAPIACIPGLERLNIRCSPGVVPKFGALDEARIACNLSRCQIDGNF